MEKYTYAMHSVTTGFSIESTDNGKRNVPIFYVKTREDAEAAILQLNKLAATRK